MAVHFTKQQIDEIEQALIARSKRDSQFPGADELDGTELIPIVQNGVNKIMTYSGLWNKVAADLQEYVEESLETKVDKVEGKELSTNDFDDDYKDKLDHIQAGAEVNVQSDWTAESGDAFILHKPDLSIYATNARVEDIEALIPNAASTSNQLVDKSFVNSSIATNTAEFKGTYDTLEELMTVVANLNDYGFVRNIDSVGNVTFDRYKYTSNNTWLYEYSLNNSSFTQAQWDAINSGITAALVTKLNGIESAAQVNIIEGVQVDGSDLPITNKKVNVVLSGKVDKVAGKGLSTNDYTNSEKLKLGAFPAWSDVEASINSKVDKSGSETKDEIFTYQQTGGGLTKNAKNARVVSYKGKTYVWNQLILPGTAGTSTVNGVTKTCDGNGAYTISTDAGGATDNVTVQFAPVWTKGHKYFIAGCPAGGSSSTYCLATGWFGDETGSGRIVTDNQDDVSYWPRIVIMSGTVITTPIVFRPIMIDLTLMFGAGNELSTVEEFESLFPESYYPYNAGTLISNEAKEIESVGFNLWDEEWESGGINSSTGTMSEGSTRIRSKNYIPVIANTVYAHNGLYELVVLFYNENKDLVQYVRTDSSYAAEYNKGADSYADYPYFQTPNGCAYIKFVVINCQSYNNDICINLSDPSRNGTYEPYKKYSHKINLDSFKVTDGTNVYTINGLKSAGNVYDEIVGGKYIKRVGRVDLGTLTWNKGTFAFYITGFNAATPSSSSAVANILTGRYQTIADADASTSNDKTTYLSPNAQLGIVDSTYFSGTADAFKTAMSGVMLYYELETPIEYELVSELPTDYPVDKLGTERVISDNICPIRVSVDYHEANISDIQVKNITDYVKKELVGYDESNRTLSIDTTGNAATAGKMREVVRYNESIRHNVIPVNGVNDAYRLDRIEGRSQVWNQLCVNGDFHDGTNEWDWVADTYSVSNNVAYVTKKESSDILFYLANSGIDGHKYYLSSYVKASTSNVLFNIGGGLYPAFHSGSGNFEHLSLVVNKNSSSYLNPQFRDSSSSSYSQVQVKNVIVIDLTLLGIDNLTTPEEVEQWLAANVGLRDYYPYDAGSILSVNHKEVETVGFNVWDEEWEVGVISADSGEPMSGAYSAIRSKNYCKCIGGNVYYFRIQPSAAGGSNNRIFWYDANKVYISNNYAPSNTLLTATAPDNAAYFKIGTHTNYGPTYNHDICINLSDSSKNGTYEPYRKSTMQLGLNSIKVKSHNIWDEEWLKGTNNYGGYQADNVHVCCKNPIPVTGGTTLYYKTPTGLGTSGFSFTDANGNNIGSVVAVGSNTTLSVPSNAAYMYFYVDSGYGTTYQNDICINVSSSFNGQYEPHGDITITGGLKSAGSVRDEIVGNKYVKRVGEVDLGTLEWINYESNSNIYTSSIAFPRKGYSDGICTKGYTFILSSFNPANLQDKQGVMNNFSINGGISIKDTSYATAADFNTAMSGVMLYYELATPIEYELADDYLNIGQDFEDGTMRVIPMDETKPSLPLVADITYGVNTGSLIQWATKAIESFREKVEAIWNAVFNNS